MYLHTDDSDYNGIKLTLCEERCGMWISHMQNCRQFEASLGCGLFVKALIKQFQFLIGLVCKILAGLRISRHARIPFNRLLPRPAQRVSIFFFNNIIVLALKRAKKCRVFRNFQSLLSYRQITLPIHFHGAEYQTRQPSLIFFLLKLEFLTKTNLEKFIIYQNSHQFLSYSLYNIVFIAAFNDNIHYYLRACNRIMDYRRSEFANIDN